MLHMSLTTDEGGKMAFTVKIRAIIRHEGLRQLPATILHALKPRDFHILSIRKKDLDPQPRPLGGTAMHQNALDRLRRKRDGRRDLPAEFWRDETSGACQCAVLEINGELGGVVWLYEYPAKRPILILAPGEAELSAPYTLAKFDNRDLATALLHFATAWQLREREQIFTVSDGDDPASLEAAMKAGYQKLVTIRRRAAWGARFSVPEMKVKDLLEPSDPA
jgi:hypothetical protein